MKNRKRTWWLLPTVEQYNSWSLPSKLTFVGTYVGIISFVITIFIAVTNKEIVEAIRYSRTNYSLVGFWIVIGDTNPDQIKRILIFNNSSNSIQFSITDASNGGIGWCSFRGYAEKNTSLEGEKYEYYEGPEKWLGVSYDKSEDTLTIEDSYKLNSEYCGVGQELSGKFKRTSGGYFVEHGLLNEIENLYFLDLVRSDYLTFVERMQIYSKPIYEHGYHVITGAMKHMFGAEEAMIVTSGNGGIYAAILSDNSITTFNNRFYWEEFPPQPAIEWLIDPSRKGAIRKPDCVVLDPPNRSCGN